MPLMPSKGQTLEAPLSHPSSAVLPSLDTRGQYCSAFGIPSDHTHCPNPHPICRVRNFPLKKWESSGACLESNAVRLKCSARNIGSFSFSSSHIEK